jgi:hypothetical protein
MSAPTIVNERRDDEEIALLVDAIREADTGNGGLDKLASAGGSYIRRRLRENGFLRKIMPPKTITNAELTYLPDSELPAIIEEMEFDSPGAKSIPFNESADTELFYGSKFATYIFKITTPEFTKNIDELRTYKNDPRQIVTENSLKDLQTEEDTQATNTWDEMVGSANSTDSASGEIQNRAYEDTISRSSYVNILSHLEDLELNNGVFLLNRKTAKAFLKFNRTEVGGDLSERMFTDGLTALQEFTIFGVRHLSTIKRNLVPDNVVWQFAEPNYMGRFYVLQDVTMYVKRDKDILRFSAQEKIGFSIPNVRSVYRTEFDVTGGYDLVT